MDPPELHLAVIGAGPAGLATAISARAHGFRGRISVFERGPRALPEYARAHPRPLPVAFLPPEVSPDLLLAGYCRGSRFILGPLHFWGPQDSRLWLESLGVPLSFGSEGEVLAEIDALRDSLTLQARAKGVDLHFDRCAVEWGTSHEAPHRLWFRSGSPESADFLVLAPGASGLGLQLAQALGHTTRPFSPSLLALRTDDRRLRGVPPMSFPDAAASFPGSPQPCQGSLEILPRGLAGSALASLLAPVADTLPNKNYRLRLRLSWIPRRQSAESLPILRKRPLSHPARQVSEDPLFDLPAPLWTRLVTAAGLASRSWAQLSSKDLQCLNGQIVSFDLRSNGYFLPPGETAFLGGVDLDEIDPASFASRKCPQAWVVGGLLDLDGLPGGHNLQATWTSAHLAARSIARSAHVLPSR